MKSIKEQVTFSFTESPPNEHYGLFHIVSGEHSKNFNGIEYLTVQFHDNGQKLVFEMRYQYGGFSRADIEITESVIAIGHYSSFYLYDYINFKSLTTMEMNGYFSDILYDSNSFYIADWDKVIKFDTKGNILWTSNSSVAHDGIHFSEIKHNKLTGSGWFDPPDGPWCDFVLDEQTGELLDGGEQIWLGQTADKVKDTNREWWKFWQ